MARAATRAAAPAARATCATSCAWSALDGERVRIARWVNRPGRGWQLQEAPVMLPSGRYVEALADAGRRGVLAPS